VNTDEDFSKLCEDIAEATLVAKDLGLTTLAYILRMALMEALGRSVHEQDHNRFVN
jgi:hypothetical protein